MPIFYYYPCDMTYASKQMKGIDIQELIDFFNLKANSLGIKLLSQDLTPIRIILMEDNFSNVFIFFYNYILLIYTYKNT